jgi:hypothetical protein
MKGYFSQIAKQSGLRLTGQQDLPRPISKSGAPSGLAPLHFEETVMVPSPLPGENAMPAAGTAPRDAAAVRKGPARERRTKKEQPGTASMSDSANASRAAGETAGSPPPASMEKNPDTPRFPDNPHAAGDRSETGGPPMKDGNKPATPLPGPRVIEETVFVEAAGSGAAKERNSSTAPKWRAGPTKNPGGSEVEGKKYFSKTAEIIEKGDTEAAEAQKILFQEVQQWVADSPAAFDMAEKGTGETVETILTTEAARRGPREVNAVRESEQRENTERAERPQVAEQTFDLSIGTISVVIEEAEKSPRPEAAPPAAGSQHVTRETEREYSRLSRHYL